MANCVQNNRWKLCKRIMKYTENNDICLRGSFFAAHCTCLLTLTRSQQSISGLLVTYSKWFNPRPSWCIGSHFDIIQHFSDQCRFAPILHVSSVICCSAVALWSVKMNLQCLNVLISAKQFLSSKLIIILIILTWNVDQNWICCYDGISLECYNSSWLLSLGLRYFSALFCLLPIISRVDCSGTNSERILGNPKQKLPDVDYVATKWLLVEVI